MLMGLSCFTISLTEVLFHCHLHHGAHFQPAITVPWKGVSTLSFPFVLLALDTCHTISHGIITWVAVLAQVAKQQQSYLYE